LTAHAGQCLDASGNVLPDDAPPPPFPEFSIDQNPWSPFKDCLAYEAAEFLYHQSCLPQAQVDILMKLWAVSMFQHGNVPPFDSNEDLLSVINSIHKGVIPWEEAEIDFSSTATASSPSYLWDKYKIYFHDPHQLLLCMLQNKEFDGKSTIQHISFLIHMPSKYTIMSWGLIMPGVDLCIQIKYYIIVVSLQTHYTESAY
jgi:hypothetical protein